jgi:hypothetical protein
MRAFGWGCEGHQIVALIARAHLTPTASAAVDELLKSNPIDAAVKRFCRDRPADPMADSSTWADDTKNVEKTGTWHYIDIPLTASGPGPLGQWCPPIGESAGGKDRPGCITDAIAYEWAILRDAYRSSSDRAKALRYVIHFVGDIHQPLHDSNNNDQGGNCTALTFFGQEKPINLHAIWDYRITARDLESRKISQAALASELDMRFLSRWNDWGTAKSDPDTWAWEGNAIAKSIVYGDLKPAIPVEQPNSQADCDAERNKVAALQISVNDVYFNQALPVIDEQLAKAGYRLAGLLNATFR